jgi:hypothetical protein
MHAAGFAGVSILALTREARRSRIHQSRAGPGASWARRIDGASVVPGPTTRPGTHEGPRRPRPLEAHDAIATKLAPSVNDERRINAMQRCNSHCMSSKLLLHLEPGSRSPRRPDNVSGRRMFRARAPGRAATESATRATFRSGPRATISPLARGHSDRTSPAGAAAIGGTFRCARSLRADTPTGRARARTAAPGARRSRPTSPGFPGAPRT